MAKTYTSAEQDVHDLLGKVLAEHFSVLESLQPPLVFDVLMASNQDKDGNPVTALKKSGHPIAGMIKIVPDEERATGGPDLRIVLDALRWDSLTERRREALIHHEVTHVELMRDSNGSIEHDEYGRVAIRLRPDDWMLTGFRETVRQFGADALERDSLDRVMGSLDQPSLPFGEAAADAARVPAVESVTISGGGKSVTLTAESGKKIREVARKLRQKAAEA